MAKLMKRQDGTTSIKAEGGCKNRDTIPSTEVIVKGEPRLIDEFESVVENQYGKGIHHYKLFETEEKKVMVHQFSWYPAMGYSWEENWEIATDDSERIERAMRHKVVEEKAL